MQILNCLLFSGY